MDNLAVSCVFGFLSRLYVFYFKFAYKYALKIVGSLGFRELSFPKDT